MTRADEPPLQGGSFWEIRYPALRAGLYEPGLQPGRTDCSQNPQQPNGSILIVQQSAAQLACLATVQPNAEFETGSLWAFRP